MSVDSMSARKLLEILLGISRQLRDHPDKAEVAQDVIDILETGMGYEYLAVLAAKESGEGMMPLALSKQGRDTAFLDSDKAYVASRCSNSTAGITNWVALSGRNARVGYVADDPRYFEIRPDIKSELCVPLRVGSEVIGVLNTETTTPNAYTAADERFLETAASHIALALKYSRQRGPGLESQKQGVADPLVLITCSYCRRFRDDRGDWAPLETALKRRSGIIVSHGICPTCYERTEETQFSDSDPASDT